MTGPVRGVPPVTYPAISIVIPARNESANITAVLDQIFEAVHSSCEVLVVVDSPTDLTRPAVRRYAAAEPRVRCLVNEFRPGPADAIRYGIGSAKAGIVVVTMADGSDDARQIDDLAALVHCGAVVAAASRYAPGGRQVGGRPVKRLLSRCAGTSLRLLARTGTKDATNSFKAYSVAFIHEVGIESRHGFTIGIELTAKARRLRREVVELPTIWVDRRAGQSGFRLLAWLPAYLRWYAFCLGPRAPREP
jgi:dolichol-phosphate mannosyltransferase